jgi:diacylglycerol kinase (ATP)
MTAEAAPSGTVSGHAYVVINPAGGRSDPAATRKALEHHFGDGGWQFEVYETTGKEDVPALVREAAAKGASVVVAAGGDGTVSDVVSGLVGSDAALGIVPLGTGNILARELNIPLDLQQACALIAGSHSLTRIDVMRMGDRYVILNLSAGLTAVAMENTPKASKHRFGVVAYVWTAIRNLAGFEPRRYRLTIDGVKVRSRASEILIANGDTPVATMARTADDCALTDGRLGVYVLRAGSIFGYAMLVLDLVRRRKRRNPRVRYFEASESVRIEASPPVSVQADGDAAGETPVEVHLLHHAIGVIVPTTAAAPAG